MRPVRGVTGLLRREGLVRAPCKPRVSGHFPAGAVLLVQPRVRKRFRTICKGEPKQNQWFNAVGPLHLQRLSLQLAGQSAVGLFTSVSTLRAASARLQRPHRAEALGIVNRFHSPKGPLRPVCPLPQAHYALNALNACPVILCHRLPSETVTLCSPRPS